jgi:hypothetical protein
LRGLIVNYAGDTEEDHKLIAHAVQIEPNLIEPRFESRSEAIDRASH